MSILLSPAANVPGPGQHCPAAPWLRWWRSRGSWSRDHGRRSRSVSSGRPRLGARVLHPRSCGVLAATYHRYTRHIISTLGHVLNIYTISARYLRIIQVVSLCLLSYHTYIQVTWMVKPFTLLHNRYWQYAHFLMNIYSLSAHYLLTI